MVSLCHCFSSSQSAFYFLNGQVQFMQTKGYKVSFAVPDDGFVDELKAMFPNVKIHIIPIVRSISPFNDIKALMCYLKLFKTECFDIIHLHTPKAGLLGAIAGRLLGHKRIIFHLHGLVSLKWDQLQPGLTLFMEKVPLKLAHKVISVSNSLALFCVDNKLVEPSKISILNHGSINGIDAKNKFNPEIINTATEQLKNELNAHDKFVIGFLGRMNSDKGLSDIINVVNHLSKTISNLMVVFVGPNEMDVDAHSYLSENITAEFAYYPRTNTPQLYISVFELLIFPSYREGFGLVAAEANALKVPVVAYNIAGVRDAIAHNKTGLLVNTGNLDELVNAVKYYHDNPVIRAQHGNNGRERVMTNFAPADVWNAQLNFYEALLRD